MRFGIIHFIHGTPDEIVSLVKLAEEKNFDSYWIPEAGLHRELYVVLTQIASNTKRLTIGPCATNPYTRHPAITANALATLDEVSDGRIAIMVGAGHRHYFMQVGIEPSPKPIAIMKEMIQICRGVWSGKRFNYDGVRFTIRNLKIGYEFRKNIPIILGVTGPKMLKFAGTYADGACPAFTPLEYLPKAWEYVKEGLAKSGRETSDFRFYVQPLIAIAKDRDEAKKAVENITIMPMFLAYSCEPLRESIGLKMGDLMPGVRASIKEMAKAGAAGVDSESAALKGARVAAEHLNREVLDTLLDKLTIYGTVEDVIKRLKEYEKAGVWEVPIGPIPYPNPFKSDVSDYIKIIGEEIIPQFKQT